MNSNNVTTGQIPSAGTYKCTNCGTEITISSGDTVPPCPKCSNTSFNKV